MGVDAPTEQTTSAARSVDEIIASIAAMKSSTEMYEEYKHQREGWAEIIQISYDRLYQSMAWCMALPFSVFVADSKAFEFLGTLGRVRAFCILMIAASVASYFIGFQFWNRAKRAIASHDAFERAMKAMRPSLMTNELLSAVFRSHKKSTKPRFMRRLARPANWSFIPLLLTIVGIVALAVTFFG